MKKENMVSFPVKTFPYRVYYADTDAGGVVYYAHYLRMFEQVRALYVEDYGIGLREMEEKNCIFVCHHAEVDYHAPALLDDEVAIHTQITEMGAAHLDFVYKITSGKRRDEDDKEIQLVTGMTQMVACKRIDSRVVPTRIPKWLRDKLAGQP